MALPVNRSFDEIVLSGRVADISTATPGYVAVPCKGRLVRAYCVVDGITNSAETISFAINGGTALDDTMTIATSTAAGNVDSVEFAQSADTLVTEGGYISITSGNSGSAAVTGNFFLVIDRG